MVAVSVVIPALNEAADIGPLLDAVSAQTFADMEILVVDGGSTDGTREIVADKATFDPRIRLVENPERIIPMALNTALAEAKGRWWVRIDAHSTVGPDYVQRIVDHFEEHDWGGVGGRKNAVGSTPVGRAIAAAMGSPFMQGNSIYHYGTEVTTTDHIPFGAYPIELARELGGWEVDWIGNQDAEFDYRVRRSGRELLFDPAIAITWRCRERLGALRGQALRYGAGRFLTVKTHPDSAGVRHLVPPGLLVWTAAALLVGLRRPSRGLAMMAPYAGVVVAGTVDTLRRGVPAGSRRYIPLVLVVQHYGWGAGFIWGAWSALTKGSAAGMSASPR